MPAPRPPFRGLGARQWSHLALAALALLYGLFVTGTVWTRGVFGYLGRDFCAFYASAEIAVERGFGAVYDLTLQEAFQRPLYTAYSLEPASDFETSPTYYLPVFVLGFLPLLLLPPVPGFVLWTILSALLLVLYLGRLGRAFGGTEPGLLLLLLSYPAFLTLFFGQVNLWLLLCMGEGLLASLQGKEWRAGLWLGGLLLKPQLLVLFLPGLLVGRRFRALGGFAGAAGGVLVLSLPLVGLPGLMDLGSLLRRYSAGLATTSPEWMMNWRALALNLSALVPAPLAWGLALAGLAGTAGAALWLWLRPGGPDSAQGALVWLGTYAATGAVTWHAHIHMALPLLAPLLFLHREERLSRAALSLWAFLPAIVFFVASPFLPGRASNLAGLSTLALNLALLGWSVRETWREAGQNRSVRPDAPAG